MSNNQVTCNINFMPTSVHETGDGLQRISNEDIARLVRAIDAANGLKYQKQLLDIALEHTNVNSDKNFERVALLLETFLSYWEGEFDGIEFNLNYLQDKFCTPSNSADVP